MSEDPELRTIVIKLMRAMIHLQDAVAAIAPDDEAVQSDVRQASQAIEEAVAGLEIAAHERA